MKKFIMTMLFFATAFSFGALGNSNTMVYVCTGGSAYAYHCNRGCRGLNRCGASIRYVTLSEAYSMGRSKPCGWCYN